LLLEGLQIALSVTRLRSKSALKVELCQPENSSEQSPRHRQF